MRAPQKRNIIASAIGILAINGRAIGKSLAFGRRGTYNPANRKKGQKQSVSTKTADLLSGALPEAGHSKQDPDATRSRWNAVAAKF